MTGKIKSTPQYYQAHKEIAGKTVEIIAFSNGAIVLYQGKLYCVPVSDLENVTGSL